MYQIQPYEPFPFMTPSRIRSIKSGVRSFNQDDQLIRQERLHLVQHMSAWHQAMGQRPWLLAHIIESLSDDECVETCDFHNMQGVLFDLAHYCRFFKLRRSIDETCVDGPRVGREPDIVRRARELPSPRLLFPQDAIEGSFIPPLADLFVYDIGYFVRRREIVELYFLSQDGVYVRAMQPLSTFDHNYPSARDASA